MTNLRTNQILESETPLQGNYQMKNLQAIFASMVFLKRRFSISDRNITEGIKKTVNNTGLTGRWQILNNEPLIICDTGHNREGLLYVLDQLGKIPATAKHFIIGFVNDKDLSTVLPLFPKDAFYYFTKASVPRALDEQILRDEASKYGLNGESYPEVKIALENARKKAEPSDLIFIGGSTFVVAEVV